MSGKAPAWTTSIFGLALMLVVLVPDSANATLGTYVAASIWRTRTISVCWEESAMDAAFATQRAAVRAQIAATWEAASAVRFVGWDRCASKVAKIRIGVVDDANIAPHCKKLGSFLNGIPDGMMLNFTFQHWSIDYCKDKIDTCVRDVAAHEFGHALGFAHEQNRIDTPPNLESPYDSRQSCVELRQGMDGDVCFGAWDSASIMNYCNKHWNGDGLLSETDRAAVASLYGPHSGKTAPPQRAFGCRRTAVASSNASQPAPSAADDKTVAKPLACPPEFPLPCCVIHGVPVCGASVKSCETAKECQ